MILMNLSKQKKQNRYKSKILFPNGEVNSVDINH